MLDFSDQPYQYFPPKHSRFWSALLLYHNRTRHLPGTQQIMDVEPSGHDELLDQLKPSDRLVFLPNHSTHADAAIFLEALRQLGVTSLMMAAYDVFLRGRVHRFTMQRMGAFAVDRDGSDPKPMKQALATLEEGKHALTIFPEGNVYLTNDRITPFMDGAAFIALKAQQALQKAADSGNASGRILAVPVSIKATHLTNARMKITQRFEPLGKQLGVEADFHAEPIKAVYQAGEIALHRNLKQRGLDVPDAPDLGTLVEQAATNVLERLEAKLEVTPKPKDTPLDRVRSARRLIHEVRIDPERAVDHAAAATWADEAMLAYRIASYPMGYAAEKPTLDRVSETVEKLEEDLLTKMPAPMCRRHAYVHFNAPIDVSHLLAEHPKLRAAVSSFTSQTEAAVQAGIDHLNHHNPHPGGQMW
ncbi:MAG: 1-acyl-sn-glycerol-3-phosphate acyltransferase [Planctomycetota bacterium]